MFVRLFVYLSVRACCSFFIFFVVHYIPRSDRSVLVRVYVRRVAGVEIYRVGFLGLMLDA